MHLCLIYYLLPIAPIPLPFPINNINLMIFIPVCYHCHNIIAPCRVREFIIIIILLMSRPHPVITSVPSLAIHPILPINPSIHLIVLRYNCLSVIHDMITNLLAQLQFAFPSLHLTLKSIADLYIGLRSTPYPPILLSFIVYLNSFHPFSPFPLLLYIYNIFSSLLLLSIINQTISRLILIDHNFHHSCE
jgi:hypothetical protein